MMKNADQNRQVISFLDLQRGNIGFGKYPFRIIPITFPATLNKSGRRVNAQIRPTRKYSPIAGAASDIDHRPVRYFGEKPFYLPAFSTIHDTLNRIVDPGLLD